MQIYVYIDESGDLGFHPEKSSTHFIATALFVSDFTKLDRILKKFRRETFRNEFKNIHEIKGYKSSEKLKKAALTALDKIEDIQIIHAILSKEVFLSSFSEKNPHLLYNLTVGIIAEHIPYENVFLVVRIDKAKEKESLRADFNSIFMEKLSAFSSCVLQNNMIHHSDSKQWSGLQFVDILAWAKYQEVCRKNSDYIKLIDESKQQEHYISKAILKKEFKK
jgi:hypothetical protein